MQQRTFKTSYSILVTSIYNGAFHLGIPHFSSVGILLYHRKKKEVFKYIEKSQKENKNNVGNRKVFNLNPVSQRTNKPVLFMWP